MANGQKIGFYLCVTDAKKRGDGGECKLNIKPEGNFPKKGG
jgi:hypothetical protein